MTAKNLITFLLAYIVVHVVENLRLRSLFQRLGVYSSSSISLASFLLLSVFFFLFLLFFFFFFLMLEHSQKCFAQQMDGDVVLKLVSC